MVINIKLITLDFEGTLVDFQWKLAEAMDETLQLFSKKGIPGKIFAGMDYAAMYNHVLEKEKDWGFPGNTLLSLIDSVYDRYDLDAASRWKPIPDIHNILGRLKGYRTALVSNVGKKALLKILPEFGLLNSFGLIITRNDVHMLKPSGEGLLRAIDWAGVKKEDSIHKGDSLSDIRAARAAGVKAGIVLGGENDPETLIKQKPDLLLKRLSDLPAALKSMEF